MARRRSRKKKKNNDLDAVLTLIVGLIAVCIYAIIFVFKGFYKIGQLIINTITKKKTKVAISPVKASTKQYQENQNIHLDRNNPQVLRNKYFASNDKKPQFDVPYVEEPQIDIPFDNLKFDKVDIPEVSVIENLEKNDETQNYELPELSLLKSSERPSRELFKSAREKGEKLTNELCANGLDCIFNEATVSSTFTSIKVSLKRKGDLNKYLEVEEITKKLFDTDITYVLPYGTEENNMYILIPNSTNHLNLENILSRKTEEIGNLSFALGEDFFGDAHFGNLAKTNNYLIAGSQETGKTNLMYSIIISLLMQNTPDDLCLAIIDSKILNYATFKVLPHLLFPIVSLDRANTVIRKLCEIKEDRIQQFSKNGIRNIESYNDKYPNQKMKHIVLFVDSIDDLVSTNKTLSESLYSITSTTRITGIHIIATCLSADKSSLSDMLKTEFDGRIAFKLPNSQQSRLAIGTSGAEGLSNYGEILYKAQINDFSQRVITPYIDDVEMMNVCRFIQNQNYQNQNHIYDDLKNFLDNDDILPFSGIDPLYKEVKEYVIDTQKASTSLLQRRFDIGYGRAARLIDTLETQGVIGPAQGSKPRDVYFKNNNEVNNSGTEFLKKSFDSTCPEGLTIQELFILQFADKLKTNNNNFPKYYEEEYGITKPQVILKYLENQGYITSGDLTSALELLTVSELKALCSNYELKTTGLKNDLIKMLIDNVNAEELMQKYPDTKYSYTEKGKQIVKKYQCIKEIHNMRYTVISLFDYFDKYGYESLSNYKNNLWNEMKMQYVQKYGTYECRIIMFKMAQFLRKEEKLPEALIMYCACIFYDLNEKEYAKDDLMNHLNQATLDSITQIYLSQKYTLDDMSNILTGNIKYGIKEKYLKEKEVIDIICKAVNQKIEMDNHSN